MAKKVHIIITLCEGASDKTVSAYKPKGVWSTGKETVNACEIYNGCAQTVQLSPAVYVKVQHLLKKYPHLEWLAYLVGKQTADGYIGTDILIPKQEQSSGTVDLDPTEEADLHSVIGTIHSHHSMGAFFSGTDDAFIVPNHPVAIVVSTSGWACKVRAELPCGHYIAGKASLSMSTAVNADLSEITKIADEKISVKKTVVTTVQAGVGQYNRIYDNHYKCLLCSEPKTFTELTWKGSGWYCKPCTEAVGEVTREAWILLSSYCREHPNEERHIPFLRDLGKNNKQLGSPEKTYICSRCTLPTPAKDLITIQGRNICLDCARGDNLYGWGDY